MAARSPRRRYRSPPNHLPSTDGDPRGARPDVGATLAVGRKPGLWRVADEDLRWRCDPAVFDFKSTRELEPLRQVPGQAAALRALGMGLAMDAPGYNVFVCGLGGARKVRLAEELVRPRFKARRTVPDRCYVQNFRDARRPRLLELPAGKGTLLAAEVSRLLQKLQVDLEQVAESSWRRVAAEILEREIPRVLTRCKSPVAEEWLLGWQRRLLSTIRRLHVEDYEVNCLGQAEFGRGARVVVETTPTHANLFGWIGRRSIAEQPAVPHFSEIRRGSFLEADGGVLVVDAHELCNAHGSWSTLKNCLRYGTLEFLESESSSGSRSGTLKPEPVPVLVKVVLVGDFELYEYLYEADPDFADLFKIRVDFRPEIGLTRKVLTRDYPRLIAGVSAGEGIRPLAASGVARVIEHGVRRAGRKGKITAEVAAIEDLLREADYWAGQARRRSVIAADVERAIHEAIARVNLVEKRIAEMIADGTILIATKGSRVGQVNGLAIYDMGDYFFGKPSRITAETSVGHGGIINIERESGFSGRSHDKGVQILSGYLRSCFAQTRPLSLTASVCFEQSYSGIDGDSASTTEIYAILSSLSGLPIRQDIAVTGSLSQKGDVQPIGGVNEKVEGFYDCVRAGRGAGTEGVIIPRKNVGDLMLRPDVAAAVRRGRFHVYAIDTVAEGFEILTGVAPGTRRADGTYPPGTAYDLVDRRLEAMAGDLRRYQSPSRGASAGEGDAD